VRWDLGLKGVALLAALSLGFGVIAQLLLWSRTTLRKVWVLASAAFFVAGLLISEVWFGWATQQELQPNIDGLSFDEVLLGYAVGIPVVLVARSLPRRGR
jgi:hypothetical protein